MSTHHIHPNMAAPDGHGRPKTPGLKVIGWLMIVSAIVPMAMAIRGEGPLEIGFGLLVAGVALVVATRWLRRPS